MSRGKFPGWSLTEDGYLDEPEPEPPKPRRLGCSIFVLALLIFAASWVPGVSAEEPPKGEVGTALLTAVHQGTWAYANASHGPGYLAIPEGPGWHVTVCGPKGCLDRVSTDAGPELWLQRAGRIGDLAAVMFEEVCGPLSAGLCSGSYTVIGRPDQHPEDPPEHPDDDRLRIEDGGPAMTLPPTDVAP